MTDTIEQRRGVPVLMVGADGPPIETTQDALDLIGASFGQADVVAIPVERLAESFFDLRTGVAGEILQKFVNYRVRLAVVGDVSERTRASVAFRDLVRETNRGRQMWFVDGLEELDGHL